MSNKIENIDEVKPIFIVGSPRSGTSILSFAMRVGLGIPGYKEKGQ